MSVSCLLPPYPYSPRNHLEQQRDFVEDVLNIIRVMITYNISIEVNLAKKSEESIMKIYLDVTFFMKTFYI